jgi:hypothetical protein
LRGNLRYAAWFVLTIGIFCLIGSALSAAAAREVGLDAQDADGRRIVWLHCLRLALECLCHFTAFAFARRSPAKAMGGALLAYLLSWTCKGVLEPELLTRGALWHGLYVVVLASALSRALALEREVQRRAALTSAG